MALLVMIHRILGKDCIMLIVGTSSISRNFFYLCCIWNRAGKTHLYLIYEGHIHIQDNLPKTEMITSIGLFYSCKCMFICLSMFVFVETPSICWNVFHLCLTSKKGRCNMSLVLLPAAYCRLIPLGDAYSTWGPDDIYVNKYFLTKAELMEKTRQWTLEWKFEFRFRWSNKDWVILCVDVILSNYFFGHVFNSLETLTLNFFLQHLKWPS